MLASMGSWLLTDLPRQVAAELINQEKVSGHSNGGNDGEGSSGVSTAVMIGGVIAAGAALWIRRSMRSSTAENPDFFTLQYFGSDRNQLQKARAGCIIRNRGAFVIASAHNLDHEYPDCHVAIAEAIALERGLKLAKDENIRLSLIQGRNVEVRDRVLGRHRKPPRIDELSTLIQDIKFALDYHQIDPKEDDDKLELVGEDDIEVARALATVGGTLEDKVEIYRTIQDLPHRVAMLVNN